MEGKGTKKVFWTDTHYSLKENFLFEFPALDNINCYGRNRLQKVFSKDLCIFTTDMRSIWLYV